MINAIQFQDKRVGSTFLQQAMDRHKDINGYDEVFVNMAKKPGMRKSGFVPYLKMQKRMSVDHYIRDRLWKEKKDDGKDKKNKEHTIFKVMYNQINYHSGLWEFIVKEKLPVIHICRKNIIKQVISQATAATSKHEPVPRLDPETLWNRTIQLDSLREHWINTLKDHRLTTLNVWYEDLFGEVVKNRTYVSPKVNTKVCKFFGVDDTPMWAQTKKKNKDDVWVYVPHRGAVLKRFKNTKYEWMVIR